jgi:transcriptional regulator with XRE-family HTH domain
VATFADCLRSARTAASLTQLALAERSGIARPNIAAYEHGRREPLFDTAMTLLEAAEAHVAIEPTIAWTWSDDRRPYAIPSRLWRLSPAACLRRFDPGLHLWWSGPRRELDLALRSDRLRAYEFVLREGTPSDIEAIVDGVLLCEAWPDLTLPRSLHSAWAPLIHEEGDLTDLVASS